VIKDKRRGQQKRGGGGGGGGGGKNELRQGKRLVFLVKGKRVGVQRETCKCIPILRNLDS